MNWVHLLAFAALLCQIALALLRPQAARMLLAAGVVLVTVRAETPLHIVAIALVAGYLPPMLVRVASGDSRLPTSLFLQIVVLAAVIPIGLLPEKSLGFGTAAGANALRYGMNVCLFAIFAIEGGGRRELVAAAVAFVVAVVLQGAFGVAVLYVPGLTSQTIGGVIRDVGGLRLTGAFGDPNYCGVALAMAILLALGIADIAGTLRRRVLFWSLAGLAAVALSCTFSRTAIFSFAAGLAVYLFLSNMRSFSVWAVAVLAVAGIALAGADLAGSVTLRLSVLDDHSMELRKQVWAEALQQPWTVLVFGGGFSATHALARSTHQTYLWWLVQAGLLGCVAFAAAFIVPVLRLARWRGDRLAAAFAAAAAVVLVAGGALDVMSEKAVWLTAGLTVAMAHTPSRLFARLGACS